MIKRKRSGARIIEKHIKILGTQINLARKKLQVSNLIRRIGRLKEKFGVKREPRVVIIIFNFDNFPDDAYNVELSLDGLWAFAARGGPFTDEEIRRLRKERQPCEENYPNGARAK